MRKITRRFLAVSLMLLSMLSGAVAAEAGPKAPRYGGTLTYLDLNPSISPITWDNAAWTWKHGYDTGFFIEHMLMGDLEKGPRGSKKYDFTASAWIPPSLARGELLERWEEKKSAKKLVLHLRKGVMWQEKPGVMKAREFVADDIAYSMNRLRASRKAVPLYYDWIDRFEAVDKHTLVVHMKEWCADWQYRMGWGYHDGIQAPEQEKAPGGAGKWENACGTGPFMLTSYKEGHSQTYTKNSKYWGSEEINGKKYQLPFADKVVMMLIKDEATQIASLRTGKVDAMTAIGWKNVADLKKSNPQLKWSRYIYGNNFTMALRTDQKPFNDIRVRRALNLAVNKKEIIDSLFGGNGELHTYPFPPTFKEVYTPLDKLPPSARELFTYNPAKAKKLLAEAGYPNGFAFKAQISNSSQTQLDIAAMVVSYLAKIGVTLELEPMDYPTWLGRMTKKTHTGGIFFANDFGSPFAGIRKNFMTGQTWNPHMLSDPYIDKAWEAAVQNHQLTEKQGFQEMKKLAVYALDQAPAIILPTPYMYAAWWPWVQNYYGETRVGSHRSAPIWARVWIDQEMKRKMGY